MISHRVFRTRGNGMLGPARQQPFRIVLESFADTCLYFSLSSEGTCGLGLVENRKYELFSLHIQV
eukprot:794179-Amorphochlora_amoeboformis.AAC.1